MPARRIEGNEPVALDGQSGWLVETGVVAVFRVNGDGSRFHCFDAGPGRLLLWRARTTTARLIAVAIEPATIDRIDIDATVAAVAAGDPTARDRMEAWLAALAAGDPNAATATSRLPLPPAVMTDLTATLDAAEIRFLSSLDAEDGRRRERMRRQFDERQHMDAAVTAETLAGFAEMGGAARTAELAPGTAPLVAVLSRVGAFCGLTVRVPASSGRDTPALEALLDASGGRSRRVQLEGEWWRRDGEPFVAVRATTGEPVGLVPIRRRWLRGIRYRALFADAPAREVDATLAAELAPEAHAIYAPIAGHQSTAALIRWTLSGRRREFAVALVCGIGVVLLGMAVPQAAAILFEAAIPDADRRLLLDLGVALVLTTSGAVVLDLARALAILRLAASGAARLQLGVWDRLLDQGPTFFRAFTAGDLESRVTAVTQIRNTLSITFLGTLIGAVAALLNVFLMWSFSPGLTIAAVPIAAVALAINAAGGIRLRRLLVELYERDGQLRGLVVQLIGAVGKIRTAGAEMRAYAQWGRAYAAKIRVAQRVRLINDRLRLAGFVLAPVATAILFLLASRDVFGDSPTLSVGSFVAFSVAFGTLLAGVTTLADSTQVLLGVAAMWARLAPILDAAPELTEQRNPPGRLGGRLRVDHVRFRYRDDGPMTLDDVSIAAEPGECIAIVGPSGSGKTTLVNLLLRFEMPLAGAIYYDDRDLKGLDILAVRQQLGVVSQENKILAGSIFDNICGGHQATHEDAWAAARAAGIEDELRQMPMGLHTHVSEGGTNLSGGQRQRLLIARVLLRKPAIMIFDEATSALDNTSQAIVTNSLNQMRVTRILIAHRLSTIRQADRIYVVESGRIVQHGTFDQLMTADGLFARLMRRQVA